MQALPGCIFADSALRNSRAEDEMRAWRGAMPVPASRPSFMVTVMIISSSRAAPDPHAQPAPQREEGDYYFRRPVDTRALGAQSTPRQSRDISSVALYHLLRPITWGTFILVARVRAVEERRTGDEPPGCFCFLTSVSRPDLRDPQTAFHARARGGLEEVAAMASWVWGPSYPMPSLPQAEPVATSSVLVLAYQKQKPLREQ
ncbi:uncharacterized protein BP5553_06101 [Venustampulla echinocandica]|uniref:Uncharacterized protein n=1 Tax=Venustampulla echinocandica TaxID=2656787 RepID=A0A370TMJ6_9HELO|nr:uncharacterized protein BP5553_06101 [Venustampulla echinocandica]RDL36749.1 hypothetical protein BP5553_06101 [Venustampulla echinocandica]